MDTTFFQPCHDLLIWRDKFEKCDTEKLKSAIDSFASRQNINYVFCSNGTPVANLLYLAAEYDRLEIIQYLVEIKKADVNQLNNSDTKAIHIAASNANFDCASYLLNKGTIVSNNSVLYKAIVTPDKSISDSIQIDPEPINLPKQKEFIFLLFKLGDSIENMMKKDSILARFMGKKLQQLEKLREEYEERAEYKRNFLLTESFSDVVVVFKP